MPQIITCPDCERKLRVPEDLLGKKVRCPGCSVMFKAVVAGGGVEEPIEDPIEEPDEEPAPRRTAAIRDDRYADSPRPSRRRDEYDDDRPRRRDDYDDDDYEERGPSPRDKKAGWGKVRTGINLVMIGTWVWLGGAVLGGLGGLLGAVMLGGALTARSPQTGLTSLGFAGVLLILSIGVYYLCAFAELVLRLIGYGLCMAVPPKRDTGLKPLAITAFSLACAHVVLSILNVALSGFTSFVPSAAGRSGGNFAGTGANGLSGLCALASFVVFLFFLRSVCNNTRARHLAATPITVLLTFVGYWVAAVVIVVFLLCAGGYAFAKAFQEHSSNAASAVGSWAIIFMIVLCLLVLVYLGLNVWYVMVLQKIRDAVASFRRRM